MPCYLAGDMRMPSFTSACVLIGLVLVCAVVPTARAAGGDGEAAASLQALRQWLSSAAGTADYGAVGPELPVTIARALDLLRAPATDAAVDSALALLTAEMAGFAEAHDQESLEELRWLVAEAYVDRLHDYVPVAPVLTPLHRQYLASEGSPAGYFAVADRLAAAHLWRFEAAPLLAVASEAHARSIAVGDEAQQFTFATWLAKGFDLEYAYADAERYYREAIRLAEDVGGDAERFEAHLNLGAHFQQASRSQRALAPLREARSYAESGGAQEANVELWLGLTHSALGRLDTAIASLTRARTLYDRLDDPDKRVHTRFELARAYRRSGQPARAIRLVDSAMATTAGWTTVYHRLFRHDELSSAYAAAGRYDSAYHHFGAHVRLRDQLDSANHEREMRVLGEKYTASREEAILLAQASWVAERRRYRWGLAAAAALGLLLGVAVAKTRYDSRGRTGRQVTGQ